MIKVVSFSGLRPMLSCGFDDAKAPPLHELKTFQCMFSFFNRFFGKGANPF
jgi:hypothetical protein